MRICYLLLLPFFAAAQPCIYRAYDGFDYSQNNALEAQNSGSGWASPWFVQNNDPQLPGYQTGGGSLIYADLRTVDGHASGGRAYLTAGRRLDTSPAGPFADYVTDSDNGIGTRTGGTLWMSALLRKDQNNNQSVFAGLHGSDLAWCDNCTGEKIEFGYFEGHSDVGGQRRWTLRIGNAYYPTPVPVTIGSPAFFVLKLIFNPGGTTAELSVNPATLGAAGPPAPTVVQSAGAALVLRSVVAYLGNSPGNGSIDEVRLADSYACVAPDNLVPIDLPPVAVVTASAADGPAPLTVHLSGADSYDPEGLPLMYTWNFGDGTPAVTGMAHTHTFSALGRLSVRLTVRDASGQQHTAFFPITVRRADGTFPCQSSFTLLQQASCSGNTGRIRINDHPAVFSLKNAAGMTLSATNGNEYHNLPPGKYTYEASGASGCADRFDLYVPVDSTTCPGWQPTACDMAIGTNMSGLADWVPERPLRNLMKHVRRDFIAFDDNCFCWDNGNTAGIATTPEGYPTHIPQVFNGVPNKVRYVLSTEGANLPPGDTYVLLYDGTGTVTVQGAVGGIGSTPGRVQFQVTSTDIVFFRIESSQASDPVRNIRVLRLADEFADLDAEPFYAGFLEKIAPFGTLRFMDWGATNHNPVSHWDERTPVSYFTYATPQGVPYAVMIQLANQTKKDVWICVPHAADSNYIAQMATLFRDQLDADRTIYVEYSNEVWNWIFDQAHYNVETAPSNLNYGRAMAEKAGTVFRIWHAVFGPEKARVRRVLGMQAGFNYLNEQILSQLDPADWDYGSPTSYLGLDHGSSGNPVLHAGSSPDDILANARHHWQNYIPELRQDYNNVKLFGKEIINYEGGQHFVGNVFGVPYPYQQAMWDAQYSPGIYALYDDMLDTIRTWGSRLFANFSLASPQESVYGSWGVLNDIDIQPPYLQTAPKYQALLDNRCPDQPSNVHDRDLARTLPLTVLPNPTGGACMLKLDIPAATTAQVRVYDLLGKTVLEVPCGMAAGENFLPLDLTGVRPGLYRVVVLTGAGAAGTAAVAVLR